MAQHVFSLFLFSICDACVILKNLAALPLWYGNLKSTVVGEAAWIFDEPVDVQIPVQCSWCGQAGANPARNLVQLRHPISNSIFLKGTKRRQGGMETGTRLFSLGKSFPEKHHSKCFVAEC